MKIKSHIRKIIALAFVVLSLSFLFPAVSYATTIPGVELETCESGKPDQISQEYILTNLWSEKKVADEVLPKFSLKTRSKKYPNLGFSGIYNISDENWMALPSQGALLKEDDKAKACAVNSQGGHLEVREKFFNEVNKINENGFKEISNPKNNLGFFIGINPNKEHTFNIKWVSAKINCCYNTNTNSLVPEEFREQIKGVIKNTTGYEVEEDTNGSKAKSCQSPEVFNEDDAKKCNISTRV